MGLTIAVFSVGSLVFSLGLKSDRSTWGLC